MEENLLVNEEPKIEVIRRKLTFADGTEIPVISTPMAIDRGGYGQDKINLEFQVKEEDADVHTLLNLKNNKSDIEYYEKERTVEGDGYITDENWGLKNVFENYGCDGIGFECNYSGGIYSVKMRRKNKYIAAIEQANEIAAQNQADITYISIVSDIPL